MGISVKKIFSLIVAITVLNTSIIYADSKEENITLEEAIEYAISYNNNINLMKLSEKQVLRGVKNANDGADLSQYALNKYTDYISLYNDGGSHIEKYKEMDDKEAIQSASLAQTLILRNPNMPWSNLSQLEEEIRFVEYRFMFGSEEPKLYDDDRYAKYAKNIELASLQAENAKYKYYNNLLGAESSLRNQVTSLYLQYLDLEEMLRSQEQYLRLMKEMYEDAENKINKGIISQIDFLKAKEDYETASINSSILRINLNTIENNIKVLMGLDLDDKINLTTNINSDNNFTLVKLKDYIQMAKKSSFEYNNKKIDYDYKTKELEVYDKYVSYMTRDKQTILADKELEKAKLITIEKEIESNVAYGLENIMELKADVISKEAEYNISLDKYLQGKKQLELGLITESNLNGIKLNYINNLIALTQSKRDVYNADIKFELLINNGIAYK